jgi:phosphoglycerate dehydrogenase-like enzyme
MKIVAAMPAHTRERCFSDAAWTRLQSLGDFKWFNQYAKNDDNTHPPFASLVKENGGADVLVTGWGMPRITAQVLDACPTLKLIAHSAGSVAAVDIDAWKRNITVTNVMPMMGYGVAEFSLLFILDGLRRFAGFVKPELWGTLPFYESPRAGTMLRHKTVGLVGFGIIGRQTLDLLKPFHCKILVHDPYIKPESVAGLDAGGVELVSLDDLMSRSDAVSLHAPGTESNKGTINERNLRMLKPGAVLVNTARGILIDHDALVRVASEGKIGVYLDVTYPEPLPPDHPLRKLPNVILTPHVAGPTPDAHNEMGDCCIDEVERLIKGQPPKWPVSESQYVNQSRTT